MTREEAKQAAEVMQAYADDKAIQYRKKGDSEWSKSTIPAFDWNKYEYRVKPEPKTKFDPKTLQPFDKVLIRCDAIWCCDFYSHSYDGEHMCVCCQTDEVIPYNDETKHLVGTTDDAPEYYRYWED